MTKHTRNQRVNKPTSYPTPRRTIEGEWDTIVEVYETQGPLHPQNYQPYERSYRQLIAFLPMHSSHDEKRDARKRRDVVRAIKTYYSEYCDGTGKVELDIVESTQEHLING